MSLERKYHEGHEHFNMFTDFQSVYLIKQYQLLLVFSFFSDVVISLEL